MAGDVPLGDQDNPQPQAPPPIPVDPKTKAALANATTDQLVAIVPSLHDNFVSASNALKAEQAKGADADPTAMERLSTTANSAQLSYFATLDKLNGYHLDANGQPITPQQSADNSASIAAQYARIGADIQIHADDNAAAQRRTETSEAGATDRTKLSEAGATDRTKLTNDTSQRNANVTAVLDLLQADVARGNLTAKQAADKAKAAFDAADLQRQTVDKFAPLALPADSKYFPNLAPTGAVASLAGALGLPFGGVETGGTFQVDPQAMSKPITDAYNSVQQPSGPDLTNAMQNAARALVGLGVPAQAAAAGAR